MESRVEGRSLAEELSDLAAQSRAARPDAVNAMFDRFYAELREAEIARTALAVGATAPDFELPDARGGNVRLADLLGRGPVVLFFYRGAWCPYCNLQLRAYQRTLPELRALGAQLVGVSPQLPDGSLSAAERHELAFPVLSDVGNRVAKRYGIVFALPPELIRYHADLGHDLTAYNGDDSWELPMPATFVIGADGIVRLADVDPDHTRRTEPDTILAALRS